MAHKLADWLHHPYSMGVPHTCERGNKVGRGRRIGHNTPSIWEVADASEGGNKVRSGPQVSGLATSHLPYRGSPTLESRGPNEEVAHKWADWPHHPCCNHTSSGLQVEGLATSLLPSGGSRTLQSGGPTTEVAHKWADWLHHPPYGVSPRLQCEETKSEVTHKWADWLHHCTV